MKQCDLNPSIDEGTKGAEVAHSFSHLRRMSQAEIVARLLGHYYVAFMPVHGLQELCETLRDMLEFYTELPVKEQPALPQSFSVKAKVTATVVRPDFTVDYDEE
jgi:hypothetical protein